MKNALLFLLLLPALCFGQGVRSLFRVSLERPGPVIAALSIVGADSVVEGGVQPYQVVATSSLGQSFDVSTSATFTVSRGVASGLTLINGSSVRLSSAANMVRGDNRITTLTATYQGVSVRREIVLADATAGYTAVAPRPVNTADMAKWPQMKLGDLIVQGATFVVASQGDYSVQIRSSQKNVPTLAPGATVWIKGARYSNFTLQLNTSHVPPGQPPIRVRNYDGQVQVLNTFTLLGAQGVNVSGKFEVGIGGDSDYRGHDVGSYAFTANRYGWLLDNRWSDPDRAAIVMDGGCQNVEWSYMEVRNGYFSAMKANNNNYDLSLPGSTEHVAYDRIKIHDLYIHDIDSEGLYLGKTDVLGVFAQFPRLEVYNNRLLRCGSEAIQVGQLAGAVTVHHNVTHGNLKWRDNFQAKQDNNLQTHIVKPGVEVASNLFIGGGEKHLNGQTQMKPEIDYSGGVSADSIVFRNNAFLNNRGTMYLYFNTQSATISGVSTRQTIPGLSFVFDRNYFSGQRFNFNEVYLGTSEFNFMMRFDVISATIRVTNNTFDGSSSTKTTWVNNVQPGSTAVIQSNNNLAGTVPAPRFKNYMGLPVDFDYTRVEMWADSSNSKSTMGKPADVRQGPILHPAGDIRVHKGYVYEVKVANMHVEPGVTPGWKSYYNVWYYDLKTGDVVKNPTSLTGLTNIPPDDTEEDLAGFFRLNGIGNYSLQQ